MADDNDISSEVALTYAHAFLTIMQNSLRSVPPGLEELFVGEVVNDPIVIYDLTEAQLFYDFPIALHGKRLGSVRIAATKLLGNPWIAIQQALPFDVTNARQEALTALATLLPDSAILTSTPVCHLYPSVGLLLRVKLADGTEATQLFDPENIATPIAELPEGGAVAGADHIEGVGAFSILESLPEAGDPAASFDRFDKVLDSIVSEFHYKVHGKKIKINKKKLSVKRLKEAFLWNAQNQPEGSPPAVAAHPLAVHPLDALHPADTAAAEKLLTVQLIPQDGSVFCVLACIQMLANFLQVGPLPSQSAMAQTLEQPPPLFTADGGIFPADQAAAFKEFFPAGYQVTVDTAPSWTSFVSEIDSGRPFKSGITGHARVAIGYQSIRIGTTQGSVVDLQRSLWINDPAKSAGMILEPHEIVELDPADLTQVISVTPRIPFKNNSVFVRQP